MATTAAEPATHVVASGTLDRPKALEALRANANKVAPDLANGVFLSGSAFSGDAISAYLRSEDYIACSEHGGSSGFGRGSCTFTANGKSQKWPSTSTDHVTRVVIPLARTTVSEVTGIRVGVTGMPTGEAAVSFNYNLETNAFGKAFVSWVGSRHFCGVDYPKRFKQIARSSTAIFAKFDDGWRLSEIEPATSLFNEEGATLCGGL